MLQKSNETGLTKLREKSVAFDDNRRGLRQTAL
jgi:hypothetical protein